MSLEQVAMISTVHAQNGAVLMDIVFRGQMVTGITHSHGNGMKILSAYILDRKSLSNRLLVHRDPDFFSVQTDFTWDICSQLVVLFVVTYFLPDLAASWVNSRSNGAYLHIVSYEKCRKVNRLLICNKKINLILFTYLQPFVSISCYILC